MASGALSPTDRVDSRRPATDHEPVDGPFEGRSSAGRGLRLGAWVALGVCFGGALAPLFIAFGRRLWAAEHYRFAPLLLVAVGWLGFRRYLGLREEGLSPGRPVVRFFGWTAVVTVSALAVLSGSPYAAAVATLCFVPVAVYEFGGSRLLRSILPLWAISLIAFPPPSGLDQRVIVKLQRTATSYASGGLDLSGIPHLADGVVIRLPGAEFFVDQACSGVHSLFASLAFTGVFAVLVGHGLLRTVVLLASAVAWVIIGNTARVFAVVILSTRYGLPVTDGLGHEILGAIVFAAVIGLIVSTDRLLLFLAPVQPGLIRRFLQALLHRKRKTTDLVEVVSPERPRSVVVPACVAVAFFGLIIADRSLPSAAAAAADLREADGGLTAVAEDAVPASWQGWRRVDFDIRHRTPLDPAGEWSRIWSFQKGRLTAAVSIDGPYPDWHDLGDCYDALGFDTVARRNPNDPSRLESEGRHTELSLEHPGGRHGFALFKAYSAQGEPLSPPPTVGGDLLGRLKGDDVIGRLKMAYWRLSAGRRVAHRGSVYQVQVFSESRLPFTEADRRDLQDLFHEMRERLTSAGGEIAVGRGPERTADPVGEALR